MKIKYFILAFILIFLGTFNVQARDQEYIESVYPYYEQFYRVVGAVKYYDDRSATLESQGKKVSSTIWSNTLSDFKLENVNYEMTNLYNYYNNNRNNMWQTGFAEQASIIAAKTASSGNWSCENAFVEESKRKECEQELRDYKVRITEKTSLVNMFEFSKNWLNGLVSDYGTITKDNESKLKSSYENTIESTIKTYDSLCGYLEDSPGVTYYLTSALKITSYLSVVLAVILGAIDFIKAITSGDDAALKKAFQSFLKRLIAVALVFSVYLIVKIIVGIVPKTRTTNFEMCEILKP